MNNIGFCLSLDKDLARQAATTVKYIKEEVSGVDVSIFTKMTGSFNVPCGVFSYPEMWYFRGYLFTFSLSDIYYVIKTKQSIKPVFLYLGQPLDILGLLTSLKDHDVECVTSSETQRDEFFRLTKIKTSQLKGYIKKLGEKNE